MLLLRRKLLTLLSCTAAGSWFGNHLFFTPAMAFTDPRPEFAADTIDDVLNFYFGTTESEDDASIKITIPLATVDNRLVPFKINAPGAEKIAVFTDANPKPLVMAMEQVSDRRGTLVGQAQLMHSGSIFCYVLRDGVLSHGSRQILVSGHWSS